MFLWPTLNRFTHCLDVSIIDFEEVTLGWVKGNTYYQGERSLTTLGNSSCSKFSKLKKNSGIIVSLRQKYWNALLAVVVISLKLNARAHILLCLIHIRSMLLSYRNQSIDLACKSIHWFLYECYIGLVWFDIVNKGNATYWWELISWIKKL